MDSHPRGRGSREGARLSSRPSSTPFTTTISAIHLAAPRHWSLQTLPLVAPTNQPGHGIPPAFCFTMAWLPHNGTGVTQRSLTYSQVTPCVPNATNHWYRIARLCHGSGSVVCGRKANTFEASLEAEVYIFPLLGKMDIATKHSCRDMERARWYPPLFSHGTGGGEGHSTASCESVYSQFGTAALIGTGDERRTTRQRWCLGTGLPASDFPQSCPDCTTTELWNDHGR